MTERERGPLTEAMFYILMSLLRHDVCGTDIADFVCGRTDGRVRIGPGTLYTLLGKFQTEQLITEIAVEGRKRTYRITEKGKTVYYDELARLRRCVADAEKEEEECL